MALRSSPTNWLTSPNNARAGSFCTSVSPIAERISAGVSVSRSSTRNKAGATKSRFAERSGALWPATRCR